MHQSINHLRGRRGTRGNRGTRGFAQGFTVAARGFTLVEILIVVIILGILAAIVIPQFSNATSQARTGNLQTQCQTVRQAIALYSLQHNGAYPQLNGTPGWTQLTEYTDATGTLVSATSDATHPYGPYLPSAPVNPVCPSAISTAVGLTGTTTSGWYYNPTGGNFAACGSTAGSYFNETDGADTTTAPW